MHTYVFICDCICVHMREAEQPSRKNPHVSLRTKVTMQDRKKSTPHKESLPQKNHLNFGIATVLSARFHKH